MSREAGWSIDWTMVNRNLQAFIDARVHAHATADAGPLRDVLAPSIRLAEEANDLARFGSTGASLEVGPGTAPGSVPHILGRDGGVEDPVLGGPRRRG